MQNDGQAPTTHITDSRGRIRVESSDPTNPKEGEFYFNRLTNTLNRYNGTKWLGTPFND